MGKSWHDGGADVLTSAEDLYVALGVRMRERPAAHWAIEMHPETRAGFDLAGFDVHFDARQVALHENSHVPPGEYHLSQRGFD